MSHDDFSTRDNEQTQAAHAQWKRLHVLRALYTEQLRLLMAMGPVDLGKALALDERQAMKDEMERVL